MDWLYPVLRNGARKTLSIEDLPPLCNDMGASKMGYISHESVAQDRV